MEQPILGMFFPSVSGDRRYGSAEFTSYFARLVTNGVFPMPSTSLQVMSNEDLTVTVKAGAGNINGYFAIAQEDVIIALDVPSPTVDRTDSIVLRWDLNERNIVLANKTDDISVTRTSAIYELKLAEIIVRRGVSAILQADITDTRLDATVCGVVDSLIQADTTTIFNQYLDWFTTFTAEQTAAFMEWLETIKDILDEETAAHLLSMIQNLETQVSLLNQTKQDKIIIQQQTPPVVEGAIWIKY